jgi:hypothetical protein
VGFGKIRMEGSGNVMGGGGSGCEKMEDNDPSIYIHEASSDLVRHMIL